MTMAHHDSQNILFRPTAVQDTRIDPAVHLWIVCAACGGVLEKVMPAEAYYPNSSAWESQLYKELRQHHQEKEDQETRPS